MDTRWNGVFVAAALLAGAGCASPGYEQSASTAESIRGASGSVDRFRESGEGMLASLNALLGEPRDDLPRKFQEYSGKVDGVLSADASLRASLLEMRADADSRFKAWERELAQYKNADIRAKSEGRLKEVRSAFEGATTRADAVLEPAAAFTADTQDLRRLLSNDLTTAGLETASDAAKKVRYGHGRVDKASRAAKQALLDAAEALSEAPPPEKTPAK